jgi:hypothetical protein
MAFNVILPNALPDRGHTNDEQWHSDQGGRITRPR